MKAPGLQLGAKGLDLPGREEARSGQASKPGRGWRSEKGRWPAVEMQAKGAFQHFPGWPGR